MRSVRTISSTRTAPAIANHRLVQRRPRCPDQQHDRDHEHSRAGGVTGGQGRAVLHPDRMQPVRTRTVQQVLRERRDEGLRDRNTHEPGSDRPSAASALEHRQRDEYDAEHGSSSLRNRRSTSRRETGGRTSAGIPRSPPRGPPCPRGAIPPPAPQSEPKGRGQIKSRARRRSPTGPMWCAARTTR